MARPIGTSRSCAAAAANPRKPRLPTSHVKKSSQVTCPINGMARWVWGSMPPGITSLPAALRVRVPGRSPCRPQGRRWVGKCAPQGRSNTSRCLDHHPIASRCCHWCGTTAGYAARRRSLLAPHLQAWPHSQDGAITDQHICLELPVSIDHSATLYRAAAGKRPGSLAGRDTQAGLAGEGRVGLAGSLLRQPACLDQNVLARCGGG